MSSIQNLQGGSLAVQAASLTQAKNPPNPTSGKTQEAKPVASEADSVQISNAAKAASQKAQESVAQEVQETPQQTAQEAAHGDLQAKRLLAQQASQQKLAGQ